MKVTFLGVGSAFSRQHANSNLLIESGTLKLLIDCSHSALPSLEQYGLSLKDVTHILITHLHADHIGGLEEVAFRSKLVYKRTPTLLTTASLLERLWQSSLRGGLEYIEATPGDSTPKTLQTFFTPQTLPSQTWFVLGDNPGIRLYLHPTDHVKGLESYGLEVEELPGGPAKRFLFSGDTKFNPSLITHGIQTCQLIFHDCQLFDSGKDNISGVHSSYQQLLSLPPDIRKHLWLYHYGDSKPPDAVADGFAGFVEDRQSFSF